MQAPYLYVLAYLKNDHWIKVKQDVSTKNSNEWSGYKLHSHVNEALMKKKGLGAFSYWSET